MNWILHVIVVCYTLPNFTLGLDHDAGKIIETLRYLEEEINILKQDNGILKRDIGVLKQDNNELKHANDLLKEDNDMLKRDIHVLQLDNEMIKQQLIINIGEEDDPQIDSAKVEEGRDLAEKKTHRRTDRLLESRVPRQLPHKIAFSVSLTHDVTLGYHQTIEYDKVLTNVGNAYDMADGHFTVPTKGLYLLSVTIFNQDTDIQPIEMVKNGIQICALHSDYHAFHMSSQTIVVVLEMNDKVWVRRFRDHRSATLYSRPLEPYNTFSGVLLFEM